MLAKSIKMSSSVSCKDRGIIFKENRRSINNGIGMESIISKEGSSTKGFVQRVVIGEFAKRQIKTPFALSCRTITSNVLFDYRICSFDLPIGLLVMRCGKSWFCPNSRAKRSPELRRELRTMVRYNGFGETMISEDIE
jgi:hypothetical protein